MSQTRGSFNQTEYGPHLPEFLILQQLFGSLTRISYSLQEENCRAHEIATFIETERHLMGRANRNGLRTIMERTDNAQLPNFHFIRRLWVNQLFRFLVVGIINTVFGYSIYLICIYFDASYQSAIVISTTLGALFNFFTTGSIVFQNSSIKNIFGFIGVYGLVMIVNIVLLTPLIESGISKSLGQAMVLPFIIIMSFTLNKFLVFRGPS
ncbi:MAG: GtrA family protein [Methylacidiphilales bacterium]|nr:GtrA family protein [Candidatus Methylacidiphilales bacterium]